MNYYVLGFAFREDDGSVALIRKAKPDWQRGYWNGIGGSIEAGELASDAMSREFKEEAGVLIPHTAWRPVGRMGGPGWTCIVFTTTVADLSARSVTEEQVRMFSEEEQRELPVLFPCIPNVPALIALCRMGPDHTGKRPDVRLVY